MRRGGEKRLRKKKSEERARHAVPLWGRFAGKVRVVSLDSGGDLLGVEEGLRI
jgi:hypothetical protein